MKTPALIGYRASGKTTVGRLLAQQLGFECVDTDVEVVRLAGCSIAEIFANQGETAFRDLESQVIEEVTRRESVVVSLGGGAILRASNREWIGRCSPVVWLQASVDVIAQRIEADSESRSQRPNLTSKGVIDEIREVLEQRTPLYESTSTLSLDTEKENPKSLASTIYQTMQRDVG